MKISLIDLTRQHNELSDDINEAVSNIFQKSSFIMGENVKNFEQEFSSYLGIKHSISVGIGTDALLIALKALNIGPGDEVITTPFTFFSTAESIARVGAIPVFVDVELTSYNIDPNKIEEKITEKTKAILPVHIFGNPCDMIKINNIAKKHNLFVIEDACQAVGAKIGDKMIGTLSDIACFSFFPTKNLGCAGDGGMIVTNNDDLATICRAYRVHGSGIDGNRAYNLINHVNEEIVAQDNGNNTIYNPMKYYNYLIGFNSRLDEFQAAILRLKLKKLNFYNEDRIRLAMKYNLELKDTKLILPSVQNDYRHVYHLYILNSDKRSSIINFLKEKGIATGIYYQIPLHLQKAFEYLNYKKGDLPNCEYLSERTFAIPLYYGMTEEEQKYIIDSILEWNKNNE